MSKRHQSTRRRTYARRQHQLHERAERRLEQARVEVDLDDRLDGFEVDPLAFVDPRTVRARFAFGD